MTKAVPAGVISRVTGRATARTRRLVAAGAAADEAAVAKGVAQAVMAVVAAATAREAVATEVAAEAVMAVGATTFLHVLMSSINLDVTWHMLHQGCTSHQQTCSGCQGGEHVLLALIAGESPCRWRWIRWRRRRF